MVDVRPTETDEFIGGKVVGDSNHKDTRGSRVRVLLITLRRSSKQVHQSSSLAEFRVRVSA